MTTIADLEKDNWPVTEATLEDVTDGVSDFAGIKLRSIARATSDLYGEVTAPDESDMPAIAKQWIADKTTVRLIPVGVDYYASKRRLSDTMKDMTVKYYDRERQLWALRDELEADLATSYDAALDAINSADAPDEVLSTPAVSTAGLIVQPTVQAYFRGPFPYN